MSCAQLGNLSLLTSRQTRSVSAENPTGGKGQGGRICDPAHQQSRELGQGFHSDLAATIQALGWRAGGRYLPLQDDVATVAFWYQAEPHAPFPAVPGRDRLEIT